MADIVMTPTDKALYRLKHLTPRPIIRFLKQILPGKEKRYVGTTEVSGELQFELLKREGCTPDSKVLELGCGHLHAGVPLMRYLKKGNYVGVDPNEWLRQHAMKKHHVRQLVEEKQARFLSVDTFDASSLAIKFDFILSHSVLSHCAHWQLEQFIRNSSKVLAPGGKILASIRLAEGNAFGSPGTPDKEDSMDKEWVYPGASWFKLSTVETTAESLGLTVNCVPAYTEFYTKVRPTEYHDWLVFCWKAAKGIE
jgi:cyclopropane fatty-acyl-phospholipid synthase-like methyltransferase